MSWLSSAAKAIGRGANDVADDIADEADRAGDNAGRVIREATKAARRGLPLGVVTGMLLGPAAGLVAGTAGGLMGGRGKGQTGGKTARMPGILPGGGARPYPMPRLVPPGYGRGGYCGCSVDPKTGETVGEGEAFTFSSRLQFTGAQATATDLGDFFTPAASTDLVTNNAFPFDFDVDEALLIMGFTYSTAVAATGTELASLLSLKLIERKYNSQEQYQLSAVELAPLTYYNGTLGTPTATAPAALAAVYQIQPENIFAPWGRRYITNQQWQLVLRTPRAFTVPANATLDLNLQLRGRRV